MMTPTRDDCLRLLATDTGARLPGWSLLRDDGGLGLLLKHSSGKVAAVNRLNTHEQARVADVTAALKESVGGRRVLVDWAVLYCEHGFLETTRAILERRKTEIALLWLDTTGTRHLVDTFHAPRLGDGEGRAFVSGCKLAIQEANFGVPREPDEDHLGFTNISIAPREVEAITFMSELEYGRRRLELVRAARQSIILSTFNIDNPTLETELISRAAKNLHVVCIVGAQKSIQYRNSRSVQRLSATKVQVFPTENHAKCLIVDRRFVIMGSANASESVHQKLEFNLELNSPALADQLLQILQARVPGFEARQVPSR